MSVVTAPPNVRLIRVTGSAIVSAAASEIILMSARMGADETAFAYRDVNFSQVIVGVHPDPANAPLIRDWTVDYWEATHPYSAGGGYRNFMMNEGADRVQATYGGNYRRLQEIKGAYDPNNLFRVNQNIPPRG